MSSASSSDDEDAYGPALPPHLLKKSEESSTDKSPAIIGPSLPPGFKLQTQAEQQQDEQSDDEAGPVVDKKYVRTESEVQPDISEEDEDDDDDDDIGPYPPDHPKSKRLYELNYSKPISSTIAKPKREEWMLIPPKNKPISNLASRKFLPRSLETRNDEDEETNEKQDLKEEFQTQLIEKRDELMSNLLSSESGSSRSAESLLELHRKNLKKRKLEEAGGDAEKKERRPFDRDSDLKIHGMSEDDKQRFIKRTTSELQGRFAHGKKAGKFL